MATSSKPAMQRFIERIEMFDCWVWMGGTSGKGHGKFYDDGRSQQAHRWSYETFVGPIPEGLVLDHTCRNRSCVNPLHLRPVTQLHNTLIGEGPTAKNRRKTHCKNGHEFTEENTLRRKDRPGHRECRECRNGRERQGEKL